MIDRDVIVDMYRGFERVLRFVGGLLYSSAKQAGRLTARRIRERGLLSRENALDMLLWSFVAAGYAERIVVDSVDERGDSLLVRLRVEGALLGSRLGRRRRPVDQPLGGYLAGWLEEVYGVRVEARETSCVARGDPVCVFEVRIGGRVELDVGPGEEYVRTTAGSASI